MDSQAYVRAGRCCAPPSSSVAVRDRGHFIRCCGKRMGPLKAPRRSLIRLERWSPWGAPVSPCQRRREKPQSSMVGLQSQQISESQFDEFPDAQSILGWKFFYSKPKSLLVLIFHRMQCCGSMKWRWLIYWTS